MMKERAQISYVVFVCLVVGISFLLSKIGLTTESQSAYEPSTVCATCHRDIHDMWVNGMHAQAYDDPIFRASFLQAFFDTKGEVTAYCLSCHDPTSQISEDFDVKRDIIGAGVTCDFCHTVQDVDLTRSDFPLMSRPGTKKTGPYLNSHSPAHDTEQKAFFKKSEFCGGCHQLVGQDGVLIIGTYQEWKESPFADEGIQCQDCHMPIEPGKKIVSEEVGSSVRGVNLHNLAGGHSVDQIRSAIKLEIKDVKQDGNTLFVTVHVSNVNSGHNVPTGTPSRRLILRTTVTDRSGRLSLEREQVFEKVLTDDKKQILTKDHEIILKASRVYYDNRIRPREVRQVPFSFTIPQEFTRDWKKRLTIEARVMYQYLPQVVSRRPMVIEIAGDRYPAK
jgi:hypothetical protein